MGDLMAHSEKKGVRNLLCQQCYLSVAVTYVIHRTPSRAILYFELNNLVFSI